MRNRTAIEIVNEVMEVIPEEHEYHFDKIMGDLRYTAPELVNNWFNNKFIPTFNRVIPYPPVEDWHFRAISALTRKTLDQVYQEYGDELNE